jgi:hypothetical protein
MRKPMSTPPRMPRTEPMAAPISVFKDACWMRTSKKMMAATTTAATSAEETLEGRPRIPGTGSSL